MDIEKQKEMALCQCMDIARDYTEEEVKKFCLPSVQLAWKIGDEYLSHSLEEDRKARKHFTL